MCTPSGWTFSAATSARRLSASTDIERNLIMSNRLPFSPIRVLPVEDRTRGPGGPPAARWPAAPGASRNSPNAARVRSIAPLTVRERPLICGWAMWSSGSPSTGRTVSRGPETCRSMGLISRLTWRSAKVHIRSRICGESRSTERSSRTSSASRASAAPAMSLPVRYSGIYGESGARSPGRDERAHTLVPWNDLSRDDAGGCRLHRRSSDRPAVLGSSPVPSGGAGAADRAGTAATPGSWRWPRAAR